MFSKLLLAGAFAAIAAAQEVSSTLFFTRVPNPVTVGQQTAITYSTNDSSTPTTILLRKGPSTNLMTVATLTDSATDGQFVWTPSKSLESASDYALEIKQGSQINYFGPFSIQGGTGEASSSSSSSSASASSYASASRYHSSSSAMIVPSATYGSHNATTLTAKPSAGTGSPVHRNSTMSHLTLHSTHTSLPGSAITPTATGSPTGAGFQSSQTTAPAQSTNAASSLATGSSAIALLFGAVAAAFFC